MRKSITQDMAYRQFLVKYAEKFGVGRTNRKYSESRSHIRVVSRIMRKKVCKPLEEMKSAGKRGIFQSFL